MTNYHNPLALVDTTNLSELGQQQVSEYVEYLRPRYDSIVNGEKSKEEVARYYLKWEGKYTDAAKVRIQKLNDALRISKGYLSKVRNADKLLETNKHNTSLCTWIAEHPVSCQYQMSKIPSEHMMSKYHTGEHYTQRELEKVSAETKEANQEPQPAPEPVKTQYQEQLERQQEMVQSNDKPLIRTTEAAGVYMAGGRKAILAAAAQVLYDYKYKDESLVKIIEIINELSSQAQTKPSYTAPRLSEVK